VGAFVVDDIELAVELLHEFPEVLFGMGLLVMTRKSNVTKQISLIK